jgi:hypothetical protein
MGSKNCIKHKEAPAVTMCHQCHNPLCKSCVMVTPAGSFCGSECSVIFKEMKAKLGDKGKKKGGGMGMVLVFVVLLVIAGMFVVYFAAKDKPDDHLLKKIDLIGRFLGSPNQ